MSRGFLNTLTLTQVVVQTKVTTCAMLFALASRGGFAHAPLEKAIQKCTAASQSGHEFHHFLTPDSNAHVVTICIVV